MKGRWVTLRKIEDADIPILLSWRNSSDFTTNCSTRRNRVTLEEFDQELKGDLKRDRLMQCMIENKEGSPIGTIYAYGLNKTDGYAFVTIYISPDFTRKGYGAEAFCLFADYIFLHFGLFKIYAEVYSYNTHSVDSMTKAGFAKEGIFRDHRKMSDGRHDLIRYAIFEEDIIRIRSFSSGLTKRIQKHTLE